MLAGRYGDLGHGVAVRGKPSYANAAAAIRMNSLAPLASRGDVINPAGICTIQDPATICLITAVVPPLQTRIVNRAIQVFAAMGLSPDTSLPYLWSWGRALQILDGLDELHLRAVTHHKIKRVQEERGNNVIPESYRQSRFVLPTAG